MRIGKEKTEKVRRSKFWETVADWRSRKASYIRLVARKAWQRKTDDRGFIRVGRWKIYIEEGLPKTTVELIYWGGKLRADYRQTKLVEYDCRWDEKNHRPRTIEKARYFETPFISKQAELFEVGWNREPIEEVQTERKSFRARFSEQMKLPFAEAA